MRMCAGSISAKGSASSPCAGAETASRSMGTSIGPRLSLRQAPSLALTPELRQAIRNLQMPSTELTQHVEQELELNPLLERAEPSAPAVEPAQAPAEAGPEEGD